MLPIDYVIYLFIYVFVTLLKCYANNTTFTDTFGLPECSGFGRIYSTVLLLAPYM